MRPKWHIRFQQPCAVSVFIFGVAGMDFIGDEYSDYWGGYMPYSNISTISVHQIQYSLLPKSSTCLGY